MNRRLEIRQWVPVKYPAYAVAMSGDGQYIAVGTEQGAAIYNSIGRQLLDFPPSGLPMPVHQLAAIPDMGQVYIGAREGQLIRLDLQREGSTFRSRAHPLYHANNDLNTIALSAKGQFVAVGHLSPGLALLDADGHIVWRRHPDDGTATEGQIWHVALGADDRALYVGSGGTGTNHLAAIEISSGALRAYCDMETRVTGVAVLAGDDGVAAALEGESYTSRVLAYDADLEDVRWEHTFDEPVTALTGDAQHPLLAVAVGYEGEVTLVDAKSGRILAAERATSVVNDLSIARGRFLAAATQDGHLALMRYLSEEPHL